MRGRVTLMRGRVALMRGRVALMRGAPRAAVGPMAAASGPLYYFGSAAADAVRALHVHLHTPQREIPRHGDDDRHSKSNRN